MSVIQKIVLALLSGIMVLVVGVLSFATVRQLVLTTRGVDLTVDAITRLERIAALLRDAESGQRGYLLTGDSAYIATYERIRDSLSVELAVLAEANQGNATRLARIDTLSTVVTAKFAELDSTLATFDRAGFGAAAAMVRTDLGRRLMDESRRLVSIMEHREASLRRDQEAQRRRAARSALWVIGAGTLIAFVLIIAINRSILADVRRQQHVRESERFFNEVDSALARAPLEYAEALQAIARQAVPYLADYCGVDVASPDGTIVRAAAAHRDPRKERVLQEMWKAYPYDPNATFGAPQVLRSGAPQLTRNMSVAQVEGFARDARQREMLRELNPRSYLCVPMRSGDRTVGAISLVFSESGRVYGEHEMSQAMEFAKRCAGVLERSRLHREATESARRLGYLARTSEALASSLDSEIALSTLTRELVPEIADWCAITIKDAGGTPRQLAVAHVDPNRVRWAAELNERYPPDPDASTGVPHVLRSGEPEFYPEIPDAMLQAAARDEEHLRLMREIGFTSAIIVPIVGRGRTLGAITLVTAESGRRYTREDLALAEEVGARAGTAVDNARLVRELMEAREDAERARHAALSASRAKSDFLATMSHEIRTPINAVLGYTELLEMGLAGPLTDAQREQLGRIGSSTRHLLGLVNEVLDLAKVESGTMRIEQTSVVTGETVDAALSLVRPQAAMKGIALSEQCEGARDVHYLGDEPRVRQVLTNLIANAVKFTNRGGQIVVECGVDEVPPSSTGLGGRAYVAFRVRDTGIGIPAEQLDAIFQPFVQAKGGDRSTYARQRAGAGLGLAISRQLARLMQGEITVESRVGNGSTFTLWVPLAPDGRAVEVARTDAPATDAAVARELSATAERRAASRNGDLVAISNRLLRDVLAPVEPWRRAVRAEVPEASEMSDAELDNHVATMVTDIALALRTMGAHPVDTNGMLRDTAAILRTVSDQHGAQRHRLGWSAESVARETELLADAVERAIADMSRDLDAGTAAEASAAAREFLRQAARLSVSAFHLAHAREPV